MWTSGNVVRAVGAVCRGNARCGFCGCAVGELLEVSGRAAPVGTRVMNMPSENCWKATESVSTHSQPLARMDVRCMHDTQKRVKIPPKPAISQEVNLSNVHT